MKVAVCCAHYIDSLFLWYVCVETSIDTRNVRFFTFVFSLKFIKSVVYLKYDFCDLDIGCSNESTKDEILSVGPSQPEMIGLDVIVGLWIFVRG